MEALSETVSKYFPGFTRSLVLVLGLENGLCKVALLRELTVVQLRGCVQSGGLDASLDSLVGCRLFVSSVGLRVPLIRRRFLPEWHSREIGNDAFGCSRRTNGSGHGSVLRPPGKDGG